METNNCIKIAIADGTEYPLKYTEVEQAFACVNYFISKLTENNILNNTKIQKLLYFAFGFHYQLYGKRLFPNEIQAWPYGSVIPDVYIFVAGIMSFDKLIQITALEGSDCKQYTPKIEDAFNDTVEQEQVKNSLDLVCNTLLPRSARDLVLLSHISDSAWSTITKQGKFVNKQTIIKKNRIIDRTEKELLNKEFDFLNN